MSARLWFDSTRNYQHGSEVLWLHYRLLTGQVSVRLRADPPIARTIAARQSRPIEQISFVEHFVIASGAKQSSDKRHALAPGLLRRRRLLAMTPSGRFHLTRRALTPTGSVAMLLLRTSLSGESRRLSSGCRRVRSPSCAPVFLGVTHWQRAALGTRKQEVRFLPPRPFAHVPLGRHRRS